MTSDFSLSFRPSSPVPHWPYASNSRSKQQRGTASQVARKGNSRLNPPATLRNPQKAVVHLHDQRSTAGVSCFAWPL